MKSEPLANLTATLLLTAFLVVTLGFAIEGTFETRGQIANTFAREARIEQAQLDLEELLRLQIDEENSIRGYVLTRDPFYVAQYRQAAAGYDAKEETIQRILSAERLTDPMQLLAAYGYLQLRWRGRDRAATDAQPAEARRVRQAQ